MNELEYSEHWIKNHGRLHTYLLCPFCETKELSGDKKWY
jgi:hypothetical protein